MRPLLVPLGFYLAVTVVVPLLNGTARGAAFVEHAVIVVLASVIACGVAHLLSRRRAR